MQPDLLKVGMAALQSDSHEPVTLCFADGSTLEVQKGLLAMASTVLSEALQVEPGVTELKVEGSANIWSKLLAFYYRAPGLCFSPSDITSLLPLAHMYNIELSGIESRLQNFEFTHSPNHAMHVMTWLSLSHKYNARWLALECAKFILDAMATLISRPSGHQRTTRDVDRVLLLQRFKQGSADIDGPPDIVAVLKLAVESQQHNLQKPGCLYA